MDLEGHPSLAVGGKEMDFTSNSTSPAPSLENSRINVLVVGETQQGKSTLIKRIGQYAGLPDLDIDVGWGNRSCTTSVNHYAMDIHLQNFVLASTTDGKPFVDKTSTELYRLKPNEIKILSEDADEGAKRPTMPFTFIDTPGLDDSEGRDVEIMAGIISRLSEINHINAIIYVRSVEKPFGPSFQQFFKYIQQSMPAICNGIIIAHSCCSADRVRELRRENLSLEKLRRDAFKAATHLDLPHFFMDNDPDPDDPIAVVQSQNESCRFLSFLESQKPLSTGELQLLKTKAMQSVDAHVVNALSLLRHNLERRWDHEKIAADSKGREVSKRLRDISGKRTLLSTYKDQTTSLKSTEQILLGSRSTEKEFEYLQHIVFKRQLKLESQNFRFDADYPIADVRKTVGSGCRWKDEQLRGTNWEGVLSADRLHNLQGSITFYTTSTLKHQEKINHLEIETARLEGQLEIMEQSFDDFAPAKDTEKAINSLLPLQIDKCGLLMSTIDKQTFDMKLYPRLKHIYLSQGRPTREDISTFIHAYNPDLAEVYMIEKPNY